jgi:hypothetical protein
MRGLGTIDRRRFGGGLAAMLVALGALLVLAGASAADNPFGAGEEVQSGRLRGDMRLQRFPGWLCLSGAGGGDCSKGSDVAAYTDLGRVKLGATREVRLATQDPEEELQVKPASIAYTGDGTGFVAGASERGGRGIHWLVWNRRRAFGRGYDWLNNCRPDCARGRFHRFPATVRARRPRHGLFTRMTIVTLLHGRHVYDHRILQREPPYFVWGICDAAYTRPC